MITILSNHALHEIVEVRRMLGIDEVKVLPWNDDRIMRIVEGSNVWMYADCLSRSDK
jgi:hypothetical protein